MTAGRKKAAVPFQSSSLAPVENASLSVPPSALTLVESTGGKDSPPVPPERSTLVENVAPPVPPTLVERISTPVESTGGKFAKQENKALATLHLDSPPERSTLVENPVPPVETIGGDLRWKAEWKTISTNRRALVKRLYRRDGGKWVAVKQGEVACVINVIMHTFTPDAYQRVERRGRNEIKRFVQRLLDRANREFDTCGN